MNILITAGPTYERLDPVRFIGNYSTGKMGYALATSCANAGYQVILISGPTALTIEHPLVKRIDVESAQNMYDAVMAYAPQSDVVISCAAVADFTPISVADHKIKREGDHLILELEPTKDIASALGKKKKEGQILVGFALETNDEEANAQGKLQRKNLDFIVLNSLQDQGAGFGYDTNKVTLLDRDGTRTALPLMSKVAVADKIVEHLTALL